jgi:hypothetical protein
VVRELFGFLPSFPPQIQVHTSIFEEEKKISMVRQVVSAVSILILSTALAQGQNLFVGTSGPFTLEYANLATGGGVLPFSLPKFDPSLGSLQSVDIAFDFSGTVVGTAMGVSQSSSINGTITHWVFFDFEDLSDNVFIAEPTLALTANIPADAENTTIAFGPEFQSTSVSFSVANGDPRFEAWGNGPGNFAGSLDVHFTNTTIGYSGLQFFSGTDSGVYSGSLSIAYNYVPVPEPEGFTLVVVGLLLLASARPKHPKAANTALEPTGLRMMRIIEQQLTERPN